MKKYNAFHINIKRKGGDEKRKRKKNKTETRRILFELHPNHFKFSPLLFLSIHEIPAGGALDHETQLERNGGKHKHLAKCQW